MSQKPSQGSTLPDPPPFQSPDLETDLPGFSRPATPPEAQDDPAVDPSSPSEPSAWESESAQQLLDEPLDAPSTRKRTRSPVSTSPDSFVGVIAALLQMITFFLHLRLAPRHVENDVWIADQQDLEAIAPPLSRIAARHSPLEGGPAGDVGDAIEAVIGIGGYGIKNLAAARELRPGKGWQQQAEANPEPEKMPQETFQPFPPTL